MKQVFPLALLILLLSACKSKPASQSEIDLSEITKTIHQFAQWYHDYVNGVTESQQFIDKKGPYARLDSAGLESYLVNLKSSGMVSESLLEGERAYYRKCEPFWQNENKEEELTGMDANRFFCGQDWDIKLWASAPVSAEGLGTDEVVATMGPLEGGRSVQFSLEKEVDKWLITAVDCGEESFIETEDYTGSYYSDDKSCAMTLQIALRNGAYAYEWKTARRKVAGTMLLNRSESETYLVFKGLTGGGKQSVEALFSNNSIMVQNSGNAQNPYQHFNECKAKYITFTKGVPKPEAEKAVEIPAEKPKAASKPAKKALPVVTLNRYGDITLSGKKIALVDLRKALQAELLKNTVIPDQLLIKPIGEVGMGARHELQTVVLESISGAKWARKKAALEVVNQAVSNRLNAETELDIINNYQTNGYYALVDAKPRYANGNPVDYSISPYKYEYQSGNFADRVIAILKFEKGKWKILTYTIGANSVPVNAWVKKYGIPRKLFER
ncbi:MAG: hypothetical protein IT261_07470 [Saprospiraceae bacterium]|nr:hypothetical protein [Saprospiraceae bacterium]